MEKLKKTPFLRLQEHIEQGSHVSVMKKEAKKMMRTTWT